MRNFIKKIIPLHQKEAIKKLMRQALGIEAAGLSFSTCGEDRILKYLFLNKKKGFYVDVGAFYPIAASNTYLFYLMEWQGINIDAFPGSMKLFDQIRPNDINLEFAVSDSEDFSPYYQIGDGHSSMNSFSREFHQYFEVPQSQIKEVPIKTYPLSKILDNYMPSGKKIDFMLIDAEGFELKILKSNDWKKYRPTIVMAECHRPLSDEIFQHEITLFMNSINYRIISKTPNEMFFLEKGVSLDKTGCISN